MASRCVSIQILLEAREYLSDLLRPAELRHRVGDRAVVFQPQQRRGVRTAPEAHEAKAFFTVIHPFHPWRGRRFELLDLQQRWGQWRVYYLTEEGHTAYLPASWTDAGSRDPFVEQARGRAIARIEDLLELTKMADGTVKEIRPHV